MTGTETTPITWDGAKTPHIVNTRQEPYAMLCNDHLIRMFTRIPENRFIDTLFEDDGVYIIWRSEAPERLCQTCVNIWRARETERKKETS